MLVRCLELQVLLLLRLDGLGRGDIEIEGNRLVSINATKVPLISLADTDLSRRDELIRGDFDGSALADSATDLEVRAAKDLSLGEESHLELTVLIKLEEFLEAFLENRVTKR